MAETKGTDIVGILEDFFKKAPPLPDNIREVIVKIAPWVALIFGVLGILAGLGAIGISPVALFAGVKLKVSLTNFSSESSRSSGFNSYLKSPIAIISISNMLWSVGKLVYFNLTKALKEG